MEVEGLWTRAGARMRARYREGAEETAPAWAKGVKSIRAEARTDGTAWIS